MPSQLVRALHRYCKGQASNPDKPVFDCDDILYIDMLQQPQQIRYRKNLASLERVSSENKGKQPKGEKKVQQTNKKTGTKQIKNVQRKRKYSGSSR